MAGKAKQGPSSEEVAARIRELIQSGDIATGEPIPALSQLREIYGATETVAREAVKKLAAERLIERRAGKGNYVTDPSAWAPSEVAQFMQQLVALRDEVRDLAARVGQMERRGR